MSSQAPSVPRVDQSVPKMTKVELTDLQLLLLRQVIKQAVKDFRYDHALTGLPEEVRRAEVLEAIDEMLVTQHEAQYVGPSDDFNEDEPDTRKIKLFNKR